MGPDCLFLTRITTHNSPGFFVPEGNRMLKRVHPHAFAQGGNVESPSTMGNEEGRRGCLGRENEKQLRTDSISFLRLTTSESDTITRR